MDLRQTYTLFAPWYDRIVAGPLATARAQSLARLPPGGTRVLLGGIGTGLDLPYLPTGPLYVGVDITPAMLKRAQARSATVALAQARVERLPFAAATFDHVVLHLILAVAPDACATLAEAARVVRPGGLILIFDKFLRRGQRAPVRRLMSPLLGRLATHTDRVFEDIAETVPGLHVLADAAGGLGGYFRHITLTRRPT
ncbi:MAG: class I SAM-dependent methyltransferase [Acidiferrobacter sp.]